MSGEWSMVNLSLFHIACGDCLLPTACQLPLTASCGLSAADCLLQGWADPKLVPQAIDNVSSRRERSWSGFKN